MTRFSTFGLLYMAALAVDLVDGWRYPGFTIALLLLFAWTLWRGFTLGAFVVYLLASTVHSVLIRFPDVPNHVNIELCCNFLILVAIAYTRVRKTRFPGTDDVFELIRPILQVSAVLMYSLAGFHKLNHDFLDTEVSCARMMLGPLSTVLKQSLFGIPIPLLVAAVLVPLLYLLLLRSRWRQYLAAMVIAGGLGLAAVAAVLALAAAPGVSTGVRAGVLAMAGVIILWELGGGLLLTVPRAQWVMLLGSWVMHASLALIGFLDFASLALALLFVFLPRPWFDLLNRPVPLPALRIEVHRVHLYLFLAVLATLVGLWSKLAAGLLFDLGLLMFIWPLITAAVAPPAAPAWVGVPLTRGMTPRWMYLFPLALLLHGLTAYLGLRTTGNFSMYSNLRTEGARSNHLLLAGNPLKIWGYQEDVVGITRIDGAPARNRVVNHPLQGYRLPVVEFRKLIYGWTRVGATIPVTFEYRGRTYATPDITQDPAWRVDAPDWEMRLLDFRVIQPEGPNQCRW